MRLNCINLVSTEPERLRSFYAMVLQEPYNEIVPGRSEILVGEVKLVFTRTSVQTPVNPDSCGLEFAVEDVDAQYRAAEAGRRSGLHRAGDLPVGLARFWLLRSGRQSYRFCAAAGRREIGAKEKKLCPSH